MAGMGLLWAHCTGPTVLDTGTGGATGDEFGVSAGTDGSTTRTGDISGSTAAGSESGSGDSGATGDATLPEDALFLLAQGDNASGAFPDWAPMTAGSQLKLVLGSQGLMMFPIVVLARGIVVPDPPANFVDPKAPQLTLSVDIDGEDGVGGHYTRVANYALRFRIRTDGGLESMYVPLIVPDDFDMVERLRGKSGVVRASLKTWRHGMHEGAVSGEDAPLTLEIPVTIAL